MTEPITTTTTLKEWLLQPPTIVIYRPDGQLSFDQLPDMVTPDAVVCFVTMHEAKGFLGTFEGFRPMNLSLDDWLAVIRTEAAKGRTHLSIFEVPGNGTLKKRIVRIEDMLNGFKFAAKAIQEIEQGRNATSHQHNEPASRDGTVSKISTCPRCGGPIPNVEHAGKYPGGISRVDNQTEICSGCSEDEAMTWPNDPWNEETWAKQQRARWIRQ